MDVMLINAPLFDVDRAEASYADPPPIGLGYLGTALRRRGITTDLIDAVAEGLSVATVLERIERAKPTVVGLNVFSTNLNLVERITCGITNCDRILIGGPAAGALDARIRAWPARRPLTVVVGEAEGAITPLVEGALASPQVSDSTSGSTVRIAPDSEWYPASIDVPLDRSLFSNEPVFEPRWGHWEAHIITSRGCGHDCAFCTSARSSNPQQRIRFRSETHIAAELDEIRHLYDRVSCVRVLDDLFLRNRTSIERAAKLFAARRLHWRAMAHVTGLAGGDASLFSLLATSGCLELFVGVESGSEDRRHQIGKPQSIGPTIRVVENLLRAGINVKAYFIFGFPDETASEMRATFELAERFAEIAATTPGKFRASPFKFRPYHGTRLYDQLVASGRLPSDIRVDQDLADLGLGRPYEFTSDNYSAVPADVLNQFITNTAELNA